MSDRLFLRTVTKTITDKYECLSISDNNNCTLAEFVAARRKRYDMGYSYRGDNGDDKERKDRKKFGKCVACGRKLTDHEPTYFACGCFKNGKPLGNLFACGECYKKFGEK